MTIADSLRAQFGDIDVYLFDQLQRGRIAASMTVLDAGCGAGRNLPFLFRAGCNVLAADERPEAIGRVRELAARLAPQLPAANFRVEAVEDLSFAPQSVDVVISCAVLHFARDTAHFDAMLERQWSLLRPGGLFFARLASSIGIEDRVVQISDRRYLLPDGSERFLVDEAFLLERMHTLRATLCDPLKTTNVQNQRCMTTWVFQPTK